MNKVTKICAASFLFCLSVNVNANAVDIIDSGNYTTDSLSGLDWLDVTFTTNKHYDDVKNLINNNTTENGIDYGQWRYASGEEVGTLIANYRGESVADSNGFNFVGAGELDSLINMLGITTTDAGNNVTFGLLSDRIEVNGTVGGAEDLVYVAMLLTGASGDMFAGHSMTQLPCDDEARDPKVGSFLVRSSMSPVPVPSALLLFAPALIGLVGFRRKSA